MVILERATPSQRGEMSRLTIELHPGVFVGNISRRVREKLWDKITEKWNADSLLLWTTNTEQGYAALSNGDPSRELVDIEGLTLTRFVHKDKEIQ